jgi:hypothetical protein
MNKSSHIQKAIFVYDSNKNFIGKYDGVTEAQRVLKINHSTIKKFIKTGAAYGEAGYLFSYKRLNVIEKNSNVKFLYKNLNKRSFSTIAAYRYSLNLATTIKSSDILNP